MLELVPNLSEGRRPDVLQAVIDAFRVPGVHLLDTDGNRAANRTVLTLVGPREPLVEAAVAGALAAAAHIDLRDHQGVHTRMGSLDVCPFVPLNGSSMGEAVAAAQEAARRLGARGIPTYLYGEAALHAHRRLLHEVRRDGFEGLIARMATDPPDFGPREPHPTAGATAVGARFFLVAFNVNLGCDDVAVASEVARRVREWSRVRRDAQGRVVARERGRLAGVRATGWRLDDFGCAQVSTNLVDYRVTPPHVLFEAVREEAASLGVTVRGSELVGLVPLEALRLAGRAAGAPEGADDEALVARAREALQLDDVKPFEPRRKVLEWALQGAMEAR